MTKTYGELYAAVHALRDTVQAMREDGEQDLRTVLHYIDSIMSDFE